ncbi:MAG: hypothetical protein GEV13_31450 [Rhodospirillales bacterium]|nr:hypothetical protein [Rhodospirillales bacterium]
MREVVIAETDTEAWKLSVGGMMEEYFLRLLANFGFKDYLNHEPNVADSHVTVTHCARHNWIVGSSATAAGKLEKIYYQVGGFGTLLGFGFDSSKKPQTWQNALQSPAQEVLPRLKHLSLAVTRAAS